MDPFSAIGGLAAGIGGLFGASKDAKLQREMQERNIHMQTKFAKRGIRWKVHDAKAAGLHPLAALGAQTHSFSPVQIGSTNFQSAFSQMGQGIGDSLSAMSPTAQSQRQQDKAMAGLALERAGLENQLLKTRIASQIRTMMQPGRGPGHPGAPASGQPGDPTPSYTTVTGPDGRPYRVAAPVFPDPEQDLYRQYKEHTLIEDNLPHIRKQILKAPADFLQPVMDVIIPYLPDPIDWSSNRSRSPTPSYQRCRN